MGITLIIGIVLIGVAVYLYYQQDVSKNKEKRTASNTTTEEEEWGSESVTFPLVIEEQEKTQSTTENKAATEKKTQEDSNTTEKKQNRKLPDNYEWDEERWGEPPQIVYDFAENQEKFDFIVNEVDSLVYEGEGFSTVEDNDKLYSESENGEQLKKDIDYLLDNTNFYMFTKKVSGYWDMDYRQDGIGESYMYSMIYDPEITEEEACEAGGIKVVGNWYFSVEPRA